MASPSAKKQKTGESLKSLFRLQQTIEYPHGATGVRCMTTANDFDWLLTGSRRQIKAFRKNNDTNKWVCFKGNIGENSWNHREMRDRGGPTAMASFHDRLLIAGDAEGHINIWKMNESFNAVDWLEYEGDAAESDRAITSILILDESTFLAASLDGKLYCWGLEIGCDLEFIKTSRPFKAHRGAAIRSMVKLSNNRMATGSEDNSIKIWNTRAGPIVPIRSFTCERTLMPDEGFVVQMAVIGSKLLSVHELHEGHGKENSKIFVWDTESWSRDKVLQGGNKYAIDSVISYKGFIISSSLEGATVWNPETWNRKAVISEAKGTSTVCNNEIVFGMGFLQFYEYEPK